MIFPESWDKTELKQSIRSKRSFPKQAVLLFFSALLTVGTACQSEEAARDWQCTATEETPHFLKEIGCATDFDKLASIPLDASIPGARSIKTVIDRYDENNLYFQNSQLYPIH